MRVNGDRLAFFTSLYESARVKREEELERMECAYSQYKGSYAIDGGSDALMKRNITYELIEAQVSTEIPSPRVSASRWSEEKERNARRIELLCASVRDMLPFEKMNDIDERYTYIYGGSVFFAEWDNTAGRRGESGAVRVSVRSPLDFIGQPGICEIDDMEYCFLVFDTTADDVMRKYKPRLPEGSVLSSADSDEAVSVIVCFYRTDEGKVSRFVMSGDCVLSDIEDYWSRKTEICGKCGLPFGYCDCGAPSKLVSSEKEILSHDVITSSGRILGKGSVLSWYVPRHFPIVIRKNTSQEKSLWGQSDCIYIRPQQQEIDKILSRIHEKLIMSGVYPFKPDDCRFQPDNSIGGKVLNLKPGESPEQFGVIDTTPDIGRDMEYVKSTYDDAKRILGISDAFLGIDDKSVQSGKSRQIQVAQASGRLESKRAMKNAAYAELDRLIFELYLAFADEPRELSFKDGFGRIHGEAFCRYDFVEADAQGGLVYDDEYLFSVDTNTMQKTQRAQMWETNLENFKAGVFGDVHDKTSLLRYWQAQERAHYPNARENVEYFSG